MNTVQLEVQGMHCSGRVKRVTAMPKPLPGVSRVEVDLAASRVTVWGVFEQGPDALVVAPTAGYPATVAAEGAKLPQESGGCCG